MSMLNIFSGRRKKAIDEFESIGRKLKLLASEEPSKKRNMADIREESRSIYLKLSKKLFKAADSGDFDTVGKILSSDFISKKELVDENGYNIVEYSLFNEDNKLFKLLFEKFYKPTASYFINIPALFTIILNRKNFELIEYFLRDSDLGEPLKKENITNCLFAVLQADRKDLLDLIVKNFGDFLDVRNIEASMIYSIAHGQENEIKTLLSYPVMVAKFSPENVEKMIAFSIMNKNLKAIEIMVENPHFMDMIEKADENMLKSIVDIAYNRGSVTIINSLMNSTAIKDSVKDILKIECNKKV